MNDDPERPDGAPAEPSHAVDEGPPAQALVIALTTVIVLMILLVLAVAWRTGALHHFSRFLQTNFG